MSDITEKDIKELQYYGKDIISGKKNIKYRKNPDDINFIYGNTQSIECRCMNCGGAYFKNNPWQIMYFCSKKCRKEYREIPTKFEAVK